MKFALITLAASVPRDVAFPDRQRRQGVGTSLQPLRHHALLPPESRRSSTIDDLSSLESRK